MFPSFQAYEKYEKQLKAAKSGGGKDAKAKADKVRHVGGHVGVPFWSWGRHGFFPGLKQLDRYPRA